MCVDAFVIPVAEQVVDDDVEGGANVAPRPQNYTVKRCATGHAT